MKKYFQILILFVCVVSVFNPLTVRAEKIVDDTAPQDKALEYLKAGSKSAGFDEETKDPRLVAVEVIKIVLGLLGSIFVFLFVYSGFLLLTSSGEEEKITKARKTMFGAVSGLAVILLAYSITNLIGKKSQEIIGSGDVATPQKYNPG